MKIIKGCIMRMLKEYNINYCIIYFIIVYYKLHYLFSFNSFIFVEFNLKGIL